MLKCTHSSIKLLAVSASQWNASSRAQYPSQSPRALPSTPELQKHLLNKEHSLFRKSKLYLIFLKFIRLSQLFNFFLRILSHLGSVPLVDSDWNRGNSYMKSTGAEIRWTSIYLILELHLFTEMFVVPELYLEQREVLSMNVGPGRAGELPLSSALLGPECPSWALHCLPGFPTLPHSPFRSTGTLPQLAVLLSHLSLGTCVLLCASTF